MGQCTSDSKRVLVTTLVGFQAVIVAIHLDSGDVTTLTPVGMTSPSYALRYHCDGIMIAVRTSFTMPPQLVARRIDSDHEWKLLSRGLQPEVEPCVLEALEDLEQIQIKFQPDHYPAGRPDSPVDCEAILVRKKNWTGINTRHIHTISFVVSQLSITSGPRPAVLTMHGGPHGSVFQRYTPSVVLQLSMGAAFITPNYRGSLGYGTEFTMALPGHVGTVDVEDCMKSLSIAIDRGVATSLMLCAPTGRLFAGYVDPNRVAASGGSHGGFLVGHLMGQHPDVFKCSVLRNPVLSLVSLVHTSDIPDWSYVETFGPKVTSTHTFRSLPASKSAFRERNYLILRLQ